MRARFPIGSEALGGLSVAFAAVQFGALVVLGKVATNRGVPVSSMLAVRFAVAAIVLAIVLVATGQAWRPARGEGAKLVGLGVFGYGVEAMLFFFAIERGTASAVALLFFTYPVVVTVLAVALRIGRPTPLALGALVAAIAGAGLVVTSSGGLDITGTGIAFALASAVTFAGYLVGAELTLKRTSSTAGALWVSAAAAVSLALYALVTSARLPAGDGWLPVVAMGVFTAGAFFCLFAGLRLVGAVRTSIVAALEPLSTALLAVVFLDEPLRAGTIAGGALILTGATAATVARRRPAPEPSIP